MSRTFCIAEAGSTHDGDYEKAVRLIQVAKDAGADACKFQFWSSANRLAARRQAQSYEEVYRRYQVPVVWLSWLAKACQVAGIEFMSTVYLPEDIPVVAPFVQRFKVASFEAGDVEFIAAHRQYRRPVIVSTGMMETLDAMPMINALGGQRPDQEPLHALLHCTSSYPCPLEQANLRAMEDLRLLMPMLWNIGYSDHTASTLTGGIAVAAGAQILEVHFRLADTDPANPDYATALTPAELTEYVRLVRLAEVMLGSGVKEPQPVEAEMMPFRVRGRE